MYSIAGKKDICLTILQIRIRSCCRKKKFSLCSFGKGNWSEVDDKQKFNEGRAKKQRKNASGRR
jgi:hypothetical protein